jgi:hypothetical protein
MNKILIIIASIALLTISSVQASTTNKAHQLLIMKKMQLLADSQSYVEQEADRHVEISLEIQRYQVCIQAVNEQSKLKNCQISTSKE